MSEVSQPEFREFPKMGRLARDVIITEKIDGTNGLIYITESGEMWAGSRSRWITPEQDNYGFAKWAEANKSELLKLGPGRHFGEWWGSGCQRGYSLQKGEKRFSLFNVMRWVRIGQPLNIADELERNPSDPKTSVKQSHAPECCHVVPILTRGMFDTAMVDLTLEKLKHSGSIAAPGFMDPEGIVVWHTAANVGFKKTIKNDDQPKSKFK